MKYFYKNSQAGRSMVEVMGYMVVSMFLIAGVAKIVAGAYGEYKLSQAVIQLSDLAGVIVRVSAADSSYEATVNLLRSGSAEAKRLVPKSYRYDSSAGKIYNVFGGEVQISVPINPIRTDHGGDQFAIQYFGLDKEQCIALMTKEWINNRVVDLYAIALNNSNYWFWPIYHPDQYLAEHTLPVQVIEVAGTGDGDGLCAESNNNILWVFN